MSHTSSDHDVYAELLALNRVTFAKAVYEAAYHYLAAALHCAQARQDRQALLEVERLASAQLQDINRLAPEHPLSTQSVEERHGVSMYRNVAHIAATEAAILGRNERHNA